MKRPRRNHSAEFKARIAKEALRGVQTITEIAQANQLHPVQVSAWKKELEERMHEIFEKKSRAENSEQALQARCSDMERLLGQKVLEAEYLKKKCVQLGVDP